MPPAKVQSIVMRSLSELEFIARNSRLGTPTEDRRYEGDGLVIECLERKARVKAMLRHQVL